MGSGSETGGWQSLSAREEGGFAGLARVAHLQRGQLEPAHAARLDALLAELQALRPEPEPDSASAYPDQQSLVIDVRSGEPTKRLRFDTAQAPAALSELLTHLDFVACAEPDEPRSS